MSVFSIRCGSWICFLSHVFGQLLGIFLPQILGATSVFLDTPNPTECARYSHEHVSLLVTVPGSSNR